MYIDFIISFILCIPLWYIVGDQQDLKKKNVFFKYFIISLISLTLGIIYNYYSKTDDKMFPYFLSQIPITFLILYKIIRIPYYCIYKSEPEMAYIPENNRDVIPSLLLLLGCLTLPFLIDQYIFGVFL